MTTRKLKEISTEELVAELSRRQHGDRQTLQELEEGIEAESRRMNRMSFEARLRELERQESGQAQPCPKCGKNTPIHGSKRARTVLTVHGAMSYQRYYHYCRSCKHGFAPLDAQIQAPEEGQATRGCQRRVMDFAVNESYEEACQRFAMHYGFSVSTCLMKNIVERLPMPEFAAHEELGPQERLVVQVDGSMVPMRPGWQEAKVAVVFSDKHRSAGTANHRGHVSEATYVATMSDVLDFQRHLGRVLPARVPLKERKHTPRPEIVWLGDGAVWIWNLQKRLCPTAIVILDWMHAVQHASECGKVVLDEDEGLYRLWQQRIEHELYHGRVQTVIEELQECLPSTRGAKREALRKLIHYYRQNQRRMNYHEHREHGRTIGSGIAESAHRHVVQARMKLAGQHWSQEGAEKMVRLRAVYRTHGPEHFYEQIHQLAA